MFNCPRENGGVDYTHRRTERLTVVQVWPQLIEAKNLLRVLLRQAVQSDPLLQGLARACGDKPSISPPSEDAVDRWWRQVAKTLRNPEQRVNDHHPASPWRWRIVEAIQSRAQDPDTSIVSWLRDGAPVGIAREVVPGGLLLWASGEAGVWATGHHREEGI